MFLINHEHILFDDSYPDFCLSPIISPSHNFHKTFFLFGFFDWRLQTQFQDFLFFAISLHCIRKSHCCRNDFTWFFVEHLKMSHIKLLTFLRHLASLFSTAKSIFKFFAFHSSIDVICQKEI